MRIAFSSGRVARGWAWLCRRRVAGVLVALGLAVLLGACGYTYRPIISGIPKPGGDPQAFQLALVVNHDGNPGTTTQVNVSGDTNVANFTVGQGPVHAAYASAVGAAFVANRDSDTISAYPPSQAGSQVQTITLPAGSSPVYVLAAESSSNGNCSSGSSRIACVYVANSGSNTVGVIDSTNDVLQTQVPVGNHPVALAETPDATKLYAINNGDNTVSVISTSIMSTVKTVSVGAGPVWALMRPDGARLFVVSKAAGTVSVIDTGSDTVIKTLTVGAGPVHAIYDSRLERLWVVNGADNSVSVFDADTDDYPLLATVSTGSAPVAIAVLPDGSKAYVANSGSNEITVISALNFSVTKTIALAANSHPAWILASGDGNKVFVANHDAGSVSDIRTSDDSVVATIPTASPGPMFITASP